MEQRRFFNRDLSWLTFNERVMEEAANASAPLLERIRFLSIFSSNLDEFYRVRMPVLRALQRIDEKEGNDIDAGEGGNVLEVAKSMIIAQQERFGQILKEQLIPALSAENVGLLVATLATVFVASFGDRTAKVKSSLLLASGITAFGIFLFWYILRVQLTVIRGVWQ